MSRQSFSFQNIGINGEESVRFFYDLQNITRSWLLNTINNNSRKGTNTTDEVTCFLAVSILRVLTHIFYTAISNPVTMRKNMKKMGFKRCIQNRFTLLQFQSLLLYHSMTISNRITKGLFDLSFIFVKSASRPRFGFFFFQYV